MATDETKNISGMPDFVREIKQIIQEGRSAAYSAVNAAMIGTYWRVGKRIVEEEQGGKERAAYGKALIKTLARELTLEFGGRVLREVSGLFSKVLSHAPGYLNFANAFAKSEMVAYSYRGASG